MSGGSAVLCLLLLHTGAQGFGLLPGKSLNHLEITEKAILNATVRVCRALAQAEGTDFTLPVRIHFHQDIVPENSTSLLVMLGFDPDLCVGTTFHCRGCCCCLWSTTII